jgi:hypothetical protein
VATDIFHTPGHALSYYTPDDDGMSPCDRDRMAARKRKSDMLVARNFGYLEPVHQATSAGTEYLFEKNERQIKKNDTGSTDMTWNGRDIIGHASPRGGDHPKEAYRFWKQEK